MDIAEFDFSIGMPPSDRLMYFIILLYLSFKPLWFERMGPFFIVCTARFDTLCVFADHDICE